MLGLARTQVNVRGRIAPRRKALESKEPAEFRGLLRRTRSGESAQKLKSRLTLSRLWMERIASAKRLATLMTLQQGASGSKR